MGRSRRDGHVSPITYSPPLFPYFNENINSPRGAGGCEADYAQYKRDYESGLKRPIPEGFQPVFREGHVFV